MCTYYPFLQNGSSRAFSNQKMKLFCIHNDCTSKVSLQCEFSGKQPESGSIVALYTLMRLFPRVLHSVPFQVSSIMVWKVALCALMRLFLATVKEGMPLQIRICTEWFVALWTIVPLFTIMGLLMFLKVTLACKLFWTQFATYQVFHIGRIDVFHFPLMTGGKLKTQHIWSLSLSTLCADLLYGDFKS